MTENEAIKELSYDNTAYGGHCTEEVRRVAIHALSEIQQYRAIGTVKELKALKEKNEPKKAIGKRKYDEAYCPACNEVISDGEFWALAEYVHHCNYCGQAVKGVDWQ